MNTDLENRREDWERKHGDCYNPCKGCPNLEIDDVYGKAFCILGGGENCDLEERNGKSDV